MEDQLGWGGVAVEGSGGGWGRGKVFLVVVGCLLFLATSCDWLDLSSQTRD